MRPWQAETRSHEEILLNDIARAVALAKEGHAGQVRKGPNSLAYTHHLAEVAALVAAFDGSEAAVAAAWLHDAVEDTETTLEEIETGFGPEIAGYVAEVTDDRSLSTEERRVAQIASASSKSPMAALIKAADQTSNLRSIISSPPGWDEEKRSKYIGKAQSVVAGLQIPGGLRAAFDMAADAAIR